MADSDGARISVIMITGNVIARTPGRAIFERSLQSVAWADEIILVDSASSDETRDVARAYTDKIYIHPYQNSLKLQKQIALGYVANNWVLWVDADEVLPPALIGEIQREMRAPRVLGYQIARAHFFAGRLLHYAGEDVKMRLWRHDIGFWDGPENDEFYVVPPPVATFSTPLEHYTTANLAARLEKMAFFAPAHAALAELPPRADYTARDVWQRLLKPPLQRFYGIYWLQRGYKDGVRGLIWALLCVITEFFKFILIWERAQVELPPPPPLPPSANATGTRT